VNREGRKENDLGGGKGRFDLSAEDKDAFSLDAGAPRETVSCRKEPPNATASLTRGKKETVCWSIGKEKGGGQTGPGIGCLGRREKRHTLGGKGRLGQNGEEWLWLAPGARGGAEKCGLLAKKKRKTVHVPDSAKKK